jgi:hypothetical protein
VFLSTLTLLWQLFILFTCSLGLGLALRFLIPTGLSLLSKVLFSLIGGLFLVVLISQNLVYLGLPVRISAWLLLPAALVQIWCCRQRFVAWGRTLSSNHEIQTVAMLVLLTVTFHGIVPVQQGLRWYYGKGYPDYSNYVQLAEFLKEEPYGTSEQDIGLRPWLIKPAIGLKTQRIGQSIVTAAISVWSWTDAKGGYAATVIFFLTVLAISLFVFLRETGVDRFTAGSGALAASLLPAVTRLSLDGFLSQTSILFIFPFFASLLQARDLSNRGYVLFFSLTLAYLVSAYSEIAPIGFCTFLLGTVIVRRENLRAKRLMLLSAMILIALLNPCYLRNLIQFLGLQYYLAAHAPLMKQMAPDILTLRGWSELIFGSITSGPPALFLDGGTLLLVPLWIAGVIFLSRRDKLIVGTILLPVILIVLYLATLTSASLYPIAKIMLSVLPFVMGLVFAALSGLAAHLQDRSLRMLEKLLAVFMVAATAAGSMRYYDEVLNNEGLLRFVREPHFLKVCRALEKMKNQRLFLFENDPLLTPWLCYHARHNVVYVDAQFAIDSDFLRLAPFSAVPEFKTIDFVVAPDRIVDLRNPSGLSPLVIGSHSDWKGRQ